jgi:predicted phage terminase large subunit-like protein
MSEEKILDWEYATQEQKAAVKLLSENSFEAFHRAFFAMTQGFKWETRWFHKYMLGTLERMIKGEMQGKSLVISVPPGAGKTEIFSISSTAWAHIKSKKLRNLHVSFSDSLVRRNSIRAKSLIKSEPFQDCWPCSFGTDKDNEWRVEDDRGKVQTEILARSMAGEITGARGGFPGPGFSGGLWLDDPNKPANMFSAVKRDKDNDLVVNTLRSRRANKSKHNPTPFIIIQQRLHVDDVTGFILNGGMGSSFKFEHIKIPALIDQDYIDSLPDWIRQDCIDDICHTKQREGYWSFWPSNEDVDDLFALWEASEYTFMSQYMQSPISIGGNLIHEEWWKFYGDVDDGADFPMPVKFNYRFITADTAQKVKEHNDYSVFCEWGEFGGKLYLIDMKRGKWEAPDLRREFKSFCDHVWAQNGPQKGNLRKILVEDKSSGTGLIQELKGKLKVPITAVQRNVDKLTRAMDAAPQIEAGNVILPFNKSFVTPFVSEHSAFTIDDSHKHDDMCDNTFDAIDHVLLNPIGAGINLMKRRGSKK